MAHLPLRQRLLRRVRRWAVLGMCVSVARIL